MGSCIALSFVLSLSLYYSNIVSHRMSFTVSQKSLRKQIRYGKFTSHWGKLSSTGWWLAFSPAIQNDTMNILSLFYSRISGFQSIKMNQRNPGKCGINGYGHEIRWDQYKLRTELKKKLFKVINLVSLFSHCFPSSKSRCIPLMRHFNNYKRTKKKKNARPYCCTSNSHLTTMWIIIDEK